jgi:hypothetical protein
MFIVVGAALNIVASCILLLAGYKPLLPVIVWVTSLAVLAAKIWLDEEELRWYRKFRRAKLEAISVGEEFFHVTSKGIRRTSTRVFKFLKTGRVKEIK